MTCPACLADNRPGRKFCVRCGTPLERTCAVCGAPAEADDVFCGECGSPLATSRPAAAGDRTAPAAAPAPPAPVAASERRLVTVLFADLVGFTSLSESRDPEEVRELLSAYFDSCRRLIERYGGIVEKFIGDAVMAVWGTPVAQEDDAERAVRAALELTEAVAALGREAGADGLKARAGVLTGEAAVTIGATDQGMVAGDLVNTSARIQATAGPGQVFVGDSTRRATDASVVYEDAGVHDLKGKSEPVRLSRAVRVVAKIGGGLRSEGLEAPFVGRDRELRLLKDQFHATAEERRAHLVSVTGIAGVGKSRLGWEFYKYLDGLAGTVRWHRGRCLAYGEGVTYWALAEMVRTRAGIVEGEDALSAREQLRRAVEETFDDSEERRFVEPRLAHLLGLEDLVARDREDMFAAWRMFYERLADELPTIMLFEDMQWADPSLLDFLDYLLDWSRDHPLFVVTMSRPDLMERRANWGTGRGSTSVYLEPLSEDDMGALLEGLVPGMPGELRERILRRAQGVPLYAIETVRMLLDRGALVLDEGVYRLADGDVPDLDVPETLHALIAARLDGLSAEERRLVQDASVLGKTFARDSLAAVSGMSEEALAPALSSLVRKEVLSIQSDPLSPERGQYGFLQDLVKAVSYETLSRKDRKARHLAVAEHLLSTWGSDDDEIVEVVASHLVEALHAVPDAEDAGEIRGRARSMLMRAGERAASLAAGEEALRYFAQAVEMADEDPDRAALHERAGQMGAMAGLIDQATQHFLEAIRLFEALGLEHPAARVSARLGDVDAGAGRLESGVERMQRAYDVLSSDRPDEDLARLAAQLARLRFLRGEITEVGPMAEVALDIAEKQWLPEIISEAMNTKAVVAIWYDHPEEAFALLEHALKIALDNDVPAAALRAYGNLGESLSRRDRFEEAYDTYREGVALARRAGNRQWEGYLTIEISYLQMITGRWDDAEASADERRTTGLVSARGSADTFLSSMPEIYAARGEVDRVAGMVADYEASTPEDDIQGQGVLRWANGLLALLRGDHRTAFDEALSALEARTTLGMGFQGAKQGFVLALEAALTGGMPDRAGEVLGLLDALPQAQVTPYYHAHRDRMRARLAAAEGRVEMADAGFRAAMGMFRELGMRPALAMAQTEYAEWLVGLGRDDDARPLVTEARATLEHLRATPWLERLSAVETRAGLTSVANAG
ncbi:MAG TPA: adenylate/guanylate cyclase domain-containing protein [Actinomycetota bacterium]